MSEQAADSTPEPPAADEPAQPGSRRRWWWLAGGVTAAVLAAVGFFLWYRVVGQKVWTDDRGMEVPEGAATVRQVLWTRPEAVRGELNTPDHEYEPALSPDGTELYFVRGLSGTDQVADIYVSRRRDNAWANPVPLQSINTKSDELGPRLTPDGRFLMFYSDRPGGLGGYDIWAAERTDEGWGEPFNLGPAVNSRWNEYGAACDPAGRLYFATNRKAAEKAEGKEWRATIRQRDIVDYDLFVCEPVRSKKVAQSSPARKGGAIDPPLPRGGALSPTSGPSGTPATRPAPALAFQPARELQGVNTPYREGAGCITPGGDFLYFASNRPGGLGKFDLYRCRLRDGACSRLENLGPGLNTAANDADPQLALEGFRLYFSSDRPTGAGGNDLFVCESREVYAHRVPRRMPELGWHFWSFLIAVAVLVPLLLFLKAGGYRHLSLLQKCAFVSLLIHAMLLLGFNFLHMSQTILEYIAKEAGMTVAVNLDLAREVEVGQQIRHQVTKLPTAEPKVTDLARADEVPLPRAAPEPTEVNAPKAQYKPSSMTVQPEAPPVKPAEAAEELSLPPPQFHAEMPNIAFTPPAPIAESEARPTPQAPQPTPFQARKLPAPKLPPEEVKLSPDLARVRPKSLAEAAETPPPTPAPTERVEAQPLPRPLPAVEVAAPAVEPLPLAARQPEKAAAPERPAEARRIKVPSAKAAASCR